MYRVKAIDAGVNTFARCDVKTLLGQVGAGNWGAISGYRVGELTCKTDDGRFYCGGVVLPVANGWAVHIGLAHDDTYTVRQVFRRKTRREWSGVYAENVGDVAYRASLWEDIEV